MAQMLMYVAMAVLGASLGVTLSESSSVSFIVHQDRPTSKDLVNMKSLAVSVAAALGHHRHSLSPDLTFIHIPVNARAQDTVSQHTTLQSFKDNVRQRGSQSTSGTSCRSPLMSAIISAIQQSSDPSQIFVFSSTLENDGQLLPLVRHLASTKSVNVHIVLSTSCTGQSSLGDVAKLTEGDVLHIHQGDEKAAAEYMRHRVADMPSEVLVRKQRAMERGNADQIYFAVEESMTSLSVSISCDGQTVPVISLTPPNYRNYRSIHYTYLKAAVMAHQNTPSQGQWKVRFRAKEREMCVTVITGRVASARQTLPPTTPVATVTPIQLDPEWALTTNTPVSHARSQPFPERYNLLVLRPALAKQVRSVAILNTAGQRLQAMFRQPGTAMRSDGQGVAYGYFKPLSYDVQLQVSGSRTDGTPFSVIQVIRAQVVPTVRPTTTRLTTQQQIVFRPATVRPVRIFPVDVLPVAATLPPTQRSIAADPVLEPDLVNRDISESVFAPADISSALDLVGTMQKELDGLRAQLERVQMESTKRERDCKATEQRLADLKRILGNY